MGVGHVQRKIVMKLGREFGSRSLLSMLGVPLKISKQRISMIRLAKET